VVAVAVPVVPVAVAVMTFSGYITCGVGKPILQLGGRQEAMIVALPVFTNEADPVDVPLAVNAAASEVLQVSVGVIWVFDESVTVAVMFLDPLATVNEV